MLDQGNLARVVHPRHRELIELVDADDISGVLALASLDDVAAAWCRYAQKPSEDRDDTEVEPDWWAVVFFWARPLFEDRELHRAALLKLIERADSDDVIGQVAAGPLENFMSNNESDLQWLEANAARNPKLRQAIAGVWIDLTPANMARLDRAAGTPLTRPLPREALPRELLAVDDAQAALVEASGSEWWSNEDVDVDALAAFETATNEWMRSLIPMDPESVAERARLRGEVQELLLGLRDRLSSHKRDWAQDCLVHDIPAAALDSIVIALSDAREPITDDERAVMLVLGEKFELGRSIPRRLGLCPHRA
jgi:hypothetical protein